MNRGALADCYEEHGDALVRFAATQVGPSDAHDIVSAAMLAVLNGRSTTIEHPTAYLYRAVANAARKHFRGRDRRQQRERRFALDPTTSTRDGDSQLGDPRLTAALERLSVRQRAVIHLAYWEDLSPAMIAERLDISEGTVRKQLARARRHLRSEFDG